MQGHKQLGQYAGDLHCFVVGISASSLYSSRPLKVEEKGGGGGQRLP